MAEAVVLTALYPEMEEATVGQWLVAEGDAVEAEQPIAELITDKVAYAYPSPAAGILLAILAPEQSVVPVGTVVAALGAAGEAVDTTPWLAENRRLTDARESALGAVHEALGMATEAPKAPTTGAVRATPAARRLARERGVDLATVVGSGPDGMVTVDDIPGG
jgi:pyruvate dehydrogenase E2 component (dihydrolipoamide acetyltransferase)